MKRLFVVLLLAAGLLGGSFALASSCPEDEREIVTLRLLEVRIDGVIEEDTARWEVESSLEAGYEGGVLLSIDGDTISFERVQ